MARNLLLALVAVGALMVGLVLVLGRESTHAPPPAATSPRVPARPGPPAADVARVSRELMPDGYGAVALGMPLDELRRARTGLTRDARAPQSAEQPGEVWEETDASGARVIFLVDADSRRVTQAQFASRVGSADELRGHFDAMQARYGRPTGIWDCPESERAPPVRRFTWRREGASVMEAVLIYGDTIALTLVVALTDDVGRALVASQCRPVDRTNGLPPFPVAGTLRGQQTPFVRAVPPR